MPAAKKVPKNSKRLSSNQAHTRHPFPPIAASPLSTAMQETAEYVAKIICKKIYKIGCAMELLLSVKKETETNENLRIVLEPLDGLQRPLSELLETLNTMNDETNAIKFLLGATEKTTPRETKADSNAQALWLMRDANGLLAPHCKLCVVAAHSSLETMKVSLREVKPPMELKMTQVKFMIQSLSCSLHPKDPALQRWKEVKKRIQLLLQASKLIKGTSVRVDSAAKELEKKILHLNKKSPSLFFRDPSGPRLTKCQDVRSWDAHSANRNAFYARFSSDATAQEGPTVEVKPESA